MAPNMARPAASSPSTPRPLRYLELSGRPKPLIRLVEAYYKEQGMFHTVGAGRGRILRRVGARPLDRRKPSLAGPKRPQDRVRLGDAKSSFEKALKVMLEAARPSRTLRRTT